MLIEITYNVTDVFMSTTETPVYVEISFEQPSGSAAVWGSITGTLSNQTDLQNALNAKLDESTIDGGTEGQILSKASATDFDFAWINNYAKYLATNVRNQSGSTIGAFQVVYISGATGNKPLISLADADTEATSSKTYGVTATSIANNGTGDVVTAGELSGIDTSAFNEGDLLWLSTTAGGVVTTPPAEPAHAVFIGYVVRSHPTLGVIDVAIANGYELNELHGVQITTPTDNQGLFYNATSTLWENKSITTALGYTPVPTTRNITINGVTYDLSADRTFSVGTISGSGTTNYLPKFTGSTTLGNSLFQEGTNAIALGVTPSAWDSNQKVIQVGYGSFYGLANGVATVIAHNAYFNSSWTYATTKAAALYQIIGSQHGWYTAASGTAGNVITFTQAMTLSQSRNLSIGSTSDNGQRLQVYGDTLLRGSGNTSATTALTVQNSDSSNMYRFLNNGRILLGSDASAPFITPAGADGTGSISGLNTLFYTQVVTQIFGIGAFHFWGTTLAPTSGFNTQLSITRQFAPTSGTAAMVYAIINPTINQQGGANGITRGLYVIPGLTAAADWRSIEWSNNSGWGLYGAGTADNYLAGDLGIGTTSVTNWLNIAASTTAKAHINLAAGSTPTAPANGDIWFDGTDIKMRIGGVTKTFTLV